MMYRSFMSSADADRIKSTPSEGPAHCDATVRHEPGSCPFCDAYYLTHPPVEPRDGWTPAAANGWGGNVAPIVDDVKAAEEDAAWREAFS